MQTQIENLVKLQAVELERTRLTQALRALPTEIAQAQAALAAAERQSAEASDALSREESLRAKLEREIATHRQKAQRYRTQQDSIKTPEQATAVEHELHFAEAEAERLEAEEFASLERTEAQEAALAAARAQVELLASALEKIRTRVALRQTEYAGELAELTVEREGELLTCDSCGRLLYWDPSMAPASPAEPEHKPKRKAPKASKASDEDE